MRLPQKHIDLHPSCQLAWTIANSEACLAGSVTIRPIFILFAALTIIDDNFDDAANRLRLTQTDLQSVTQVVIECRQMMEMTDEEITTVRRKLRQTLREAGGEPMPIHHLHRSGESRYLFQKAMWRAVKGGDDVLNLSHILAELLANIPLEAAEFFGGKSPAKAIYSVSSGSSNEEQRPISFRVPTSSEKLRPSTPMINEIGRDLTAAAREGKLSPVVGRRHEITKLARYLQRTSKRNVIITGYAGVGKTAVVEGLAQRVCENAPDFLRALRVVQINVADIASGTRYRGDLEGRVQQIVNEATSDPNLVLFFDEIHLLVRSGGADMPMDIANILKPALAREDFRCIGATTTEEFERFIKDDAAFLRRFQVLQLSEPTEEEALQICREWARRIEEIQEVVIEQDAIEAAVKLTMQLIPDRPLPDKAIDVLENAASFVKITSLSASNAVPTKAKPCIRRAQIEELLEDQYDLKVQRADAMSAAVVGDVLRAELCGQREAISLLVESVNALNVSDGRESRPLGVFLFVGPTGVGKTFAAECLARALFGPSENRIGRFNMNEYKERHELARLIGAPPGFIGHDRQGALFRYLESNKSGLILLNEMEKTHPEIQDYFLQIFDQGKARDSRGHWADFRNHLFILTSNLFGSDREHQIGFLSDSDLSGMSSAEFEHQLRECFRPEFLNRIDRIVPFQHLRLSDYAEILDRRVKDFETAFESSQGSPIIVTDEVRRHLSEMGFAQMGGARGFIRECERILLTPLLEYVKARKTSGVVEVTLNGNQLMFSEKENLGS